jgi:predicted nucleotidyltransferase
MDELKELVNKLERAFSDRLISVVLYGSAAEGDAHGKFSDLNVLCVLKAITPRELADSEPVVRWWREQGHPSPLMMSEDEVHHSADSFPIEFRDMQDRRRVLYGMDAIAHLHVDFKYHRVQLEHELRAKLLRLRQHASGVLSDPEALLRLCLDSVSTFCVLGRHALLASGIVAKSDRRAVVQQMADQLRVSGAKLDMSPFLTLLDIREQKAGLAESYHAGLNVGDLFARYLHSIGTLVAYVDQLEEQK